VNDATVWQPVTHDGRLPRGVSLTTRDVHVWRVPLDLDADRVRDYANVLSHEEQARADRYRIESKRTEFIVTRGLLRRAIACMLQTDDTETYARGLTFLFGAHGKPSIAQPASAATIRCNVSHTRGLALVAVTRGLDVGIDVEHVGRVKDYLALGRRYFSETEYAELAGLPDGQQQRAFFRCWTRKEAYLKAIGSGITLGLDQFDVSLAPNEPAQLRQTRHDPDEVKRWSMMDVPLGDREYVGAMVVAGDVDVTSVCWWAVGEV